MIGQALLTSATVSLSEQRALKKRPDLPKTAQDWAAFPRTIDGFIADHFGFRETITHWNAWLRSQVWSPINEYAIYGRSGHLFYRASASLEYPEGPAFKTDSLNRLLQFLVQLNDYLKKQNIRFLFTSPPDNATINDVFLPRWARKRPVLTNYDFVMQQLNELGIPVLDLRPALRSANALHPAYYRTDTHWNRLGATVARNEIVRALGHPEWAVDLTKVLRGFSATAGAGDLAGMLAIGADVPEEVPIMDFGDYSHSDSPTVLVIGDSFSNFFPLVWANAGRLIVYQGGVCNFSFNGITDSKPEFVVFAPTERHLDVMNCPIPSFPATNKEHQIPASGKP